MIGDIRPAEVVRQVGRGERVADLVNELKTLTFRSRTPELPVGLEHGIVSRADGTRWLVRGGQEGIDLADFAGYRRLLVHTHGRPTGPSPADYNFLVNNGHWSSYVVEVGTPAPIKFSRSSPWPQRPGGN